jgi:hypothetical protein
MSYERLTTIPAHEARARTPIIADEEGKQRNHPPLFISHRLFVSRHRLSAVRAGAVPPVEGGAAGGTAPARFHFGKPIVLAFRFDRFEIVIDFAVIGIMRIVFEVFQVPAWIFPAGMAKLDSFGFGAGFQIAMIAPGQAQDAGFASPACFRDAGGIRVFFRLHVIGAGRAIETAVGIGNEPVRVHEKTPLVRAQFHSPTTLAYAARQLKPDGAFPPHGKADNRQAPVSHWYRPAAVDGELDGRALCKKHGSGCPGRMLMAILIEIRIVQEEKMKQNMGLIDRIVRIILTAVIVLLIVLNVMPLWLDVVLGILGGVFVVTSILGFCPLYLPFKISTNKK